MYGSVRERLAQTLAEIADEGLYKHERVIGSPQGTAITVGDDRKVINFCANNYLGLSSHPAIVDAARRSLDRWGYGLSSVRFICGTQTIHKELERRIAAFFGFDDAILYASAFDANGGLFETLLGKEDAVISDSLNHASIIDGIRLCKAERLVYANGNMAELESALRRSAAARTRVIATDGVFSMDGTVAKLPAICDLAEKHDALVMVDDCHAAGFLGRNGKGTPEYHGVAGRVDIVTGTLGKALGGASGGYTIARQEIVDLLRQRSRPYLFSNSLAPMIVGASITALDLLETDTSLRDRLEENGRYFRAAIRSVGLSVPEGDTPIVPVMLGEARIAHRMAELLLDRGVYVVGFSFPVVPRGAARIRTQVSAAHTREELDYTVEQFRAAKTELGL